MREFGWSRILFSNQFVFSLVEWWWPTESTPILREVNKYVGHLNLIGGGRMVLKWKMTEFRSSHLGSMQEHLIKTYEHGQKITERNNFRNRKWCFFQKNKPKTRDKLTRKGGNRGKWTLRSKKWHQQSWYHQW